MGLTTARMENKGDLSEAMERNINRALSAASIEPEASDARAIIEVARVVNAIRKSFGWRMVTPKSSPQSVIFGAFLMT